MAAKSILRNQVPLGRSTGGPLGLGGRESDNLIALETLRSYTGAEVGGSGNIKNAQAYSVRRESEGENAVDPEKV